MQPRQTNHEHVIADGDRLRQVLMNLISNAVKYTPEGGTITLRINEQYSPNPKKSQYEFICIDTGIGISEELGGIVTITVAVIIITGILGNVIADTVFHIFKIKNPLAKGLALGTASHAIGTARAIEMGPVEGAMSSLAVAVAGLLTVVFVSGFAQLI